MNASGDLCLDSISLCNENVLLDRSGLADMGQHWPSVSQDRFPGLTSRVASICYFSVQEVF